MKKDRVKQRKMLEEQRESLMYKLTSCFRKHDTIENEKEIKRKETLSQ